jgi:hypothetical protein
VEWKGRDREIDLMPLGSARAGASVGARNKALEELHFSSSFQTFSYSSLCVGRLRQITSKS